MHEMSVNSCFHQTNKKKHGQFVVRWTYQECGKVIKAPIKTAADGLLKYFFFSKKTNLDIPFELSVMIHMKYQDSFFFFFVFLFFVFCLFVCFNRLFN